MKGQTWFGVKGKLAPRYVGPYEILEKINPVTYRIALLPVMENMHNVFHVSMLRDYLRDPFHVIESTHVFLKDDYMYEERPIQIINRRIKRLRNKEIPLVKVDWQNHGETYATWETEEDMIKRYLDLFSLNPTFFQNEGIYVSNFVLFCKLKALSASDHEVDLCLKYGHNDGDDVNGDDEC
ncbi:uncharacterized protein LOC114301739 [Camellia sinensis]|uniref:uncharacterized protein LOC114301739 n=1 Tax=Camellia sinensis TaxID=4442 RepID=UPI001036C1EF|nr:uncharacterized protein LOC114301739 [Camellia sinensis]